MNGTDVGKRRVRRLVVAGLLWYLVLVWVAPGLANLVLGPERPSMDSPSAKPSEVQSGIDPRLSHVATALSRLRVTVWCWSSEDWKKRTAAWERRDPLDRKLGPWSGYTDMSASTIHLSPEICAELRGLVEHGAGIPRDATRDARAWSLGVFMHEVHHTRGLDEARATCLGMQWMEKAARLLGRTAAEGRRLATLFWEHWYDRLPPSYRSDDCRDGGGLDLRPETHVWP